MMGSSSSQFGAPFAAAERRGEGQRDRETRLTVKAATLTIFMLIFVGVATHASPPSHARVAAIVAQSAQDYAPKGWPVASFRNALAHIIWIESKDCLYLEGDHGQALGCGETHMGAVVQVVGAPVPRWLLVVNDVFSIRVAAGYLAYCYKCMGTALGAASCYNTGCSGIFNANYAYAVMQ